MSDEEDYDSSEDEDYVPSDGEAVSEEENSGEEENLDALKEDGEPIKTGKRKRKPAKQKQTTSRKRVGGIKLDNETVTEETEQDNANKVLAEQIKLEQEQKKQEQEKKRADDLWSSFMSDVGKRPEKKPVASTGLGTLSSSINKATPSKTPVTQTKTSVEETKPSSATSQKSTITVTKVYDFAGEAVKVTKEIDVNSKEGKAELKKQQEKDTEPQTVEKPVKTTPLGVKRPGGGLGGVLEKINKKPKMGTLEKSKIDWEEFKEKEGIHEELKIHNRGKQSYIERMNFLQRTDQKQFEIEKSLRLGTSSKR
ncbi:craniofacial development protein 1-like [Mercenaria mercenaria]|uniref:craniofacial development protein 1-like n=1 Tax=Mercenaria mercenaria TaxID=6596 RepID=UPI001E1D7CD7|nr:craniofacial development protein 1-like [Mercenaria mercenaria]